MLRRTLGLPTSFKHGAARPSHTGPSMAQRGALSGRARRTERPSWRLRSRIRGASPLKDALRVVVRTGRPPGRSHLFSELECQARFHFNSAAVHPGWLEFPLAQRVLNTFALFVRRTDHMDMLHHSVAINDDANRNGRKSRAGRVDRLDPFQDILRRRIALVAYWKRCSGGAALSRRVGQSVQTMRETGQQLRLAGG